MMTLKKTIVVIDDDPEYSKLIDAWLSHTEYKYILLRGNTNTFEVIEKTKPDLILLDFYMPRLNGHEMCALLKSNPRFSEIPIVFLSASTEKEAEDKAMALGAIDYLSKLIKKEALLQALEKYLS